MLTPRLEELYTKSDFVGVGENRASVRADPKLGTHRSKFMYRFHGAENPRQTGCHDHSLPNLLRALDERVYHTQQECGLAPTRLPTCDVGHRMSRFRSLLYQTLPCLPPLTPEQFLDRYSGGKRKVYERAMESLQALAVWAGDAWMKSFTKFEKDLKDACARLINPRSPRYNCELGMLIAHCEKPLFKAIARVFGGPTVLKGMDAMEMASALVDMTEVAGNGEPFEEWVALPSDFSRFDQHVSQGMLKFEHSVWMRMVPRHKRKFLAWLLKLQLVNKGRTRVDGYVVDFTIDGCRMSGDMNTSSGNCLIVCAMYFTLMEHLGIKKFRLANNGDDCILFLERRDVQSYLSNVHEWFAQMGFTLKVEDEVTTIEHLEFCQTRPVKSSRGWVMVRDPRSAMAKDLTSTCDIRNPTVGNRWLHAVRSGGLALTAGCPVLPQFYQMYQSTGVDKGRGATQELKALTESGLWRLRGKMQFEDLEVGPEQRFSFWLAFGITPDEQECLEEFYRSRTISWSAPTDDFLVDAPGLVGAILRSDSIPYE